MSSLLKVFYIFSVVKADAIAYDEFMFVDFIKVYYSYVPFFIYMIKSILIRYIILLTTGPSSLLLLPGPVITN